MESDIAEAGLISQQTAVCVAGIDRAGEKNFSVMPHHRVGSRQGQGSEGRAHARVETQKFSERSHQKPALAASIPKTVLSARLQPLQPLPTATPQP